MTTFLQSIGYDPEFYGEYDNYIGRVCGESQNVYKIICDDTMVRTAENMHKENHPIVGDWVTYTKNGDNGAVITNILPRKTVLYRNKGNRLEKYFIAANIDYGIIVMAADRDFSVNRLERYLTIVTRSKIIPIIILNKIDLIGLAEKNQMMSDITERQKQYTLLTASMNSDDDAEKIKKCMLSGKTYSFIGSSGVGKSTIISKVLGGTELKTENISNFSDRGQHTTTSRQLLIMPDGGVLIDTPGLREIGISLDGTDAGEVFSDIQQYAQKCKFRNCTHTSEPGCAVKNAIDAHALNPDKFENFNKIRRE